MSIFSKIIAGELPAYKVAEDEQHLAFLDINPNAKGHTLCIPKKETDQLFDLTQEEYACFIGLFAQSSHRPKKSCSLQAYWNECHWTGSSSRPRAFDSFKHYGRCHLC